MKIKEEIEEELTRIIKWIADQGYTVSESKEFLSLAQSIIEESAPVKEVNSPSGVRAKRIEEWFS